MNNKSKKIILITIIILIIVIIGILILIKKLNEKPKTDAIEQEVNIVLDNELTKVNFRDNYYIVKNIIENYYLSLCELNKTVDDVPIYEYEGDINQIKQELANQTAREIENKKNKIYNLFDTKYSNENGISVDNIQEKLGNYKDLNVFIEDMYTRDLSENLKLYFVYGTITEKDTLLQQNFRWMVIIDQTNRTFNMYQADYIEKNNLFELSKDKDFSMNITNVENRKYNTYQYEYINDETYVTDLITHYKQSLVYYKTGYSYNKLDKEYREKRFDGETDYEKYIAENKKRISNAVLAYYKVTEFEEYTQYLCVDTQGNYYIFRENANMDYSLILDIYTIDLPEFTR